MSYSFNFLIQILLVSLICAEAHGWGWYNYTEATVYTNYLNESVEDPGGKWTDFCNGENNLCYGFFCDDNQYLNENLECVDSNLYLKFKILNNGYVYFHDDSPNYTITTKSQEYFKELKARVNRNDSSVYIRKHIISEFDIYVDTFNRFLTAPFTFESDTIVFLAIYNLSRIVFVDYHCSLVYIRFSVVEYGNDYFGLSRTQFHPICFVVYTISMICLILVTTFYAFIRELRTNIIGKFVSVLTITNAIRLFSGTLRDNTLANLVTDFLYNSNAVWFLAMVYEIFVLLKYSNFQLFFMLSQRKS
jgi:hypothetical protein